MIQVVGKIAFQKEVIDFLGAGVVVHYWANWCEPCSELTQHIAQFIQTRYSDQVKLVLVEVDKNEDIIESEGVETVPYISFYRYRSPIEDSSNVVNDAAKQIEVATVNEAQISTIDLNLRSIYGVKTLDFRENYESLDKFIDNIITRDKVSVLLTGTPSKPMCGFTRKLCAVLRKYLGDSFTYYDIMCDNEFCQRVKVHCNWPTFPQVYVNGQLIGGYDIVIELDKEGELKGTFFD